MIMDVSLLEDHASVGDQDPLSAFYQNDDRVAGDVQVADAVPDPGVAFLKGDFLELDECSFSPKDSAPRTIMSSARSLMFRGGPVYGRSVLLLPRSRAPGD